jgi:type I restriction enzyme S subunit
LGVVDNSLVSGEYLLKDGDILFVRSNGNKNLVGRTMIIQGCNEKVSFSGFCIRFRPNANIIHPMYLLYVLKSPLFRKRFSQTQQSNINNINQDTLEDYVINVPDMDVQKQLSRQIEILDRKIALNNAINTELEKAAKLLYNYWFVQFDFPNAEGKPYRASGGKMIYNGQLKRKIPNGWKAQKLNKTSLCTMVSSGINAFDGEKIYLSTSEVDGIEIVNHSVTTDYANRLQRANMQPRFNSVWFAKMKDTVKNILVNEGAEILASDYIFSTGFAGLQCTSVSLYYVWNYLRGGYFENKKNLVATGATQQAINDDDLKDFDILEPPVLLIEQFSKTVEPYYHMISKSKFENKELTALRDFLLPLLMNGQVTVAASKAAVTEVKKSAVPVPAASNAKVHRVAVFKRLVLSAYILDNICDEPTAGRVKFEKLLFLSEHCARLPLHSEFHRAAAGPYDARALYAIENQLQRNQWFIQIGRASCRERVSQSV